MHHIHVYKPTVEIELTSDTSSLEFADILESLSFMVNHKGLKNVSIEDLEIFAGRPCESYIGYGENVEDALKTFCRKVAPDNIQAIIIYAFTSNNLITGAHALEKFVDSCSDMFDFTVKWGINRAGKELKSEKILVLYSTEKATPNRMINNSYQVEEYLAYRKVMLPLGISSIIKKGDINWEFFK